MESPLYFEVTHTRSVSGEERVVLAGDGHFSAHTVHAHMNARAAKKKKELGGGGSFSVVHF